MNVVDLLKKAAAEGASDVFLIAGLPVTCRINGLLIQENEEKLLPKDTEELITQIYQLAENRSIEPLQKGGDDDFSLAISGVSRFRVNAYKQRGTLAAVIRVITFHLPKPEDLAIPDAVIRLGAITRGLVLVTGPAGSGKSTTQACMVDAINAKEEKHIITLEDPLEYLHSHKRSIVSQREIRLDTQSYVAALRAALRQSPDVILLGEMRDAETTSVAMTAAETGHLIISTMHTIGAANTIDRIIDIFPPSQQSQITVQLSMSLMAVVSQQLVPSVDGRRLPVFEIMTVTPAIRNMIRENKVHQISGILYSSTSEEMRSMDASLLSLFQSGRITKDTALTYATNPDMLGRRLGN
ncbi:PilT/PilU family type 4a pilus ATPase [Cuneatibacter sp. NSJ-177]|uniref:type IV pilus twitching motility protein PilT n=1 Tax=Cuneatibacter sp. NSJ-177 TaxID=2931401 RepID=UPI001FD4E6DB|nr:PilT/PilU family type 4a pilus ATPase [Cuneatibacter sp. NSJ-177]MCJ7836825.1 PilT/PilU family type 4a pilus ATPase [Cuneatibacter sp. NSJ-177]